MNHQHITRLEEQLERLVEGAFASVFGRHLRAHDVAVALARAMESGALAIPGDTRPLAPDQYQISAPGAALRLLLERQPDLPDLLSGHLLELADHAGYRLNIAPAITFDVDDSLNAGQLVVKARHSDAKRSPTAVMKRVNPAPANRAPANPQLVILNKPPIPLRLNILNIGRSRENHIVIDDPAVSRHHLQLRLRAGRYMLFDTQSNSGTYVNGVRVKEHTLQTGDVILIGATQLVYTEDTPLSDTQTGTYPMPGIDAPDHTPRE